MLVDLKAHAVLRRHAPVGETARTAFSGRATVWVSCAIACALVWWGGVGRDLREAEATLGIAAYEPIGPFGQALGGWAPTLPAARVLPSWLVARWPGLDTPGWADVVHVPGAIASCVLVLLVAGRCSRFGGPLCGSIAALATACSLAIAEHPWAQGFDPLLALPVVLALDRILNRGSDAIAGLWASLAVLTGGWPSLAAVLLPVVVLGRAGAYVSWQLMVPPLLAFVAWSIWALSKAPAVVWGTFLMGPLKQPMAWELLPWVIGMSLPVGPLALLAVWPSVRSAWSDKARRWALGWMQMAGVLALAGTFLPGLNALAAVPLTLALIQVASLASASLLRSSAATGPRALFLIVTVLQCLAFASIGIPYFSYLGAAVAQYRAMAWVVAGILTAALTLVAVGAWEKRVSWGLASLLGIALSLKMAHAAIYTPEWNYRAGQGPWGRAIGQWVLPGRPIYVFHPWPIELAFATGHSVRPLVKPEWLAFLPDGKDAFVLLSEAEFEHWPPRALPIQKIRAFQDSFGQVRVLARTGAGDPRRIAKTSSTAPATSQR